MQHKFLIDQPEKPLHRLKGYLIILIFALVERQVAKEQVELLIERGRKEEDEVHDKVEKVEVVVGTAVRLQLE